MRHVLRRAALRGADRLARWLAAGLERLHARLLPTLPEAERASLLLATSRAFPAEHLARNRSGEAFHGLFRALERRGLHLTPRHFYFPLPDTEQLARTPRWATEAQRLCFDLAPATQLRFLSEIFPLYRHEYEAFAQASAPELPAHAFHLRNGLFDGIDALSLHAMVRHFRPARIVEVGSGFSTRVAAAAARLNGATRLTAIEPFPDPVLKAGFPGLSELIERRVQDLDPAWFESLGANDILFIDSSHVVIADGDVPFLFLEILPRLAPGVIVHVHDIFLPRDYPRRWVLDNLLFWNEQYLLQAFLACNRDFRVLLANAWLREAHPEALRAAFPTSPPETAGQSFWMQRVS